MATGAHVGGAGAGHPGFVQSLWQRQLVHYPDSGRRFFYLGLTVLATIVLYYELYIQGAVATKIIAQYHFSFTSFVFVLVVGNAIGAFASLFAGLADRWGRANLVVGGLLLTGLLIEFGLPNATNEAEYYVFFALISLVEGIALVATPALIRDFSPQVGRGVAMGFWTMGPVLGSLLVTEVSSHTLGSHPDWQYQFHLCGIIGLVVWAICFATLKELSPGLRDQLMHSMRDRALVEARAMGLNAAEALKGGWHQMLRLDIMGPALAISIFLMLYYIAVAFFVVYFQTVFGYTPARTNNLANWYWAANAVALIVCGVLSDRLLVRKPFMVAGTLLSLLGVGLFASAATSHDTSYGDFQLYFMLMSVGGGIAYVAWMSAFTETVEHHNPAATATGLAVWGWIIRIVVTLSYALLTIVVPATSTLVDKGPRLQSIVASHPAQIATLQKIDPATAAQLATSPAAQAKAVSELSGVPVPNVVKVIGLSTADAQQIATASALDPATQVGLATQPGNKALQVKAVTEIATKFGVPPAQAVARLVALSKVPVADLLLLKADGPKVAVAGAALKSLGSVPKADLAYLGANAGSVTKAQKDNPGQWQTFWWICFAAQVLFLPFVFLLVGRWSPRKAREDEAAHSAVVERELAALAASRTA